MKREAKPIPLGLLDWSGNQSLEPNGLSSGLSPSELIYDLPVLQKLMRERQSSFMYLPTHFYSEIVLAVRFPRKTEKSLSNGHELLSKSHSLQLNQIILKDV